VRDHVSQPYTTNKIIVFYYVSVFQFLDRRWEHRYWTEW